MRSPWLHAAVAAASVAGALAQIASASVHASGVFPALTVSAASGPARSECGHGALMAWADRLYTISYLSVPNAGSGTGLYEIDENMTQRLIASHNSTYVRIPKNARAGGERLRPPLTPAPGLFPRCRCEGRYSTPLGLRSYSPAAATSAGRWFFGAFHPFSPAFHRQSGQSPDDPQGAIDCHRALCH